MEKWINEVFLPEVNGKEKVALIMDNCGPHNVAASSDKIGVIRLPENTTAPHQPLDQGNYI
jgi:hypothetical protein